jgi:hypothetical protein
MQIALIDRERHWFTNVKGENFMIRNEILFSKKGNWPFM